jgi:hypothetical protein
VHAGGSGDYGGEKRNVLIVSVLLPIAVNALRSKTQSGTREEPVQDPTTSPSGDLIPTGDRSRYGGVLLTNYCVHSVLRYETVILHFTKA